ncbi:RND efflux pump membrane fusion protein barrel-sandwich domain-containing protein [uncultured Gammaproteobacteria bacterium]
MDGAASIPAVGQFLDLLRRLRHARCPAELSFLIVNDTRSLTRYRQAALAQGTPGRMRLRAVSSVAVLEHDAPYVRWLEAVLNALATAEGADICRTVNETDLPEDLRTDWGVWASPAALWCPLLNADGGLIGTLWLHRDADWTEAERAVLGELTDGFTHAWLAIHGGRPPLRKTPGRPWLVAIAAMAVATALCFAPVRQSVLAPAEVTAHQPWLVAAPIDGVVKTIAVASNTAVSAGQVLIVLEDIAFRGKVELAERALDIAMAEYHQASQGAFGDRRSGGQLTALAAQIQAREAELGFAQRQLERATVTAPRGGIVIFTDPRDWIGRPVAVGERIMSIADPADAELKIMIPVEDGLVILDGADVLVFLDVDPLNPLKARLVSAAYEAEVTPLGVLAYRGVATFTGGGMPPRLGLQATAKIYGESVPLGFYLFRRPLAALRRHFGL